MVEGAIGFVVVVFLLLRSDQMDRERVFFDRPCG
jgi:hypothetical protein